MSKSLTYPMSILLSLKEKRHGYEIMQYVEALTNGRVKISLGTLYSLWARFKDNGYVDLVSDDSNKKTYILSKLGNGILNNKIQRL